APCGARGHLATSPGESHPRNGLQELAVVLVAQELGGAGRIEPAELVDLSAGDERAAQRRHLPVANELGPAVRVPVLGARQLAPELAAPAGLLLDLPQRGLLE